MVHDPSIAKPDSVVLKNALLCIALLLICSCGGPSAQPLKGRVDAIVVLAGSHQERVPAAAALFKSGLAPMVILTNDGVRGGWSRKHQRNLYQVERAEELLVESGIPRERIVRLPFYGSGTIYDALAVERYVREHGIRSLLLVTSDYHSRRALWSFRRVLGERPPGIGVVGVGSAENGAANTAVEQVKLLYYEVRFGLLGLLPDLGDT